MKIMGFPSIYKQGKDLLDDIGTQTKLFGNKAFIVSDSFIRKQYSDKMQQSLCKAEIKSVVADYSGETDPDELSRLVELCRDTGCEFIIGFGGGKSQDAAKAVKIELGIPVVIIPTSASNDAATSRLAITYTKDGRFLGPRSMTTNPDAVIVDTSIITKAPVRFLVAGIGDALATYFEAIQCEESGVDNFFGGLRTHAAMAIAKTCYEVVTEYGKEAVESVKKGKITKAVDDIIEANVLLSGLGFEGCGVAGAHGISQGYTFVEGVQGLHGEEVAVALITEFVLEKKSEEFINKMFTFYASIGLPYSLRSLGLKKNMNEAIDIIAKFAARKQSRAQNMNCPVTVTTVSDAIESAEKLAMKFKNN